MLRFFRQIRQSLITENRFRKYLLYAVGEILLVVIGILIALQIDSWNEGRKMRSLERVKLSEIRTELKENLVDIQETIGWLEASIASTRMVRSLNRDNIPYHDSLDVHFANLHSYTWFLPNRTAFDNLKDTGMEIIRNDSLKSTISNLYSYKFPAVEGIEKLYFHSHYNNYVKPMYMREFKTFDFPDSVKVRDYEKFITNENNMQILNFSIDLYDALIRQNKELVKNIQTTLDAIDRELN